MTANVVALIGQRYHMGEQGGQVAKVLMDTVFPKGKGTREELMAFCAVAHQYELNPFVKEIYAFPMKGGGIMPIVSIDGWLKIANAHPQMDGIETAWDCNGPKEDWSCTVTIYRKDREKPMVWTEWFGEASRPTDPWRNQPRRMLANRTQAQAIRRAFGITGIMLDEEAEALEPREVEVDHVQPATDLDAFAEQQTGSPIVTPTQEGEPNGVTSSTETEAEGDGSPSTSIDWPSLSIEPFETWCDNRVGGNGAHKDRTWIEMIEGADDGGRMKYLEGAVSRAERLFADEGKPPSSRAIMCWEALRYRPSRSQPALAEEDLPWA